MTQSCCQLINCLSLPIEPNSYGKNLSLKVFINCWSKIQNMQEDQSLKSLYPTKIKSMLAKDIADILVTN